LALKSAASLSRSSRLVAPDKDAAARWRAV